MSLLKETQWLQLTDIVLSINEIIDEVDMRRCFLERLRHLIPYEMGDFYLLDPSHAALLVRPVGVDYPVEKQKAYDDVYQVIDYARPLLSLARPVVYRDTDLLEDEEREKTDFYREYLFPAGLHFVASIILCRTSESLGVVNLHRQREAGNFSETEMFILRQIEPHLSNRLWHLKHFVNQSDIHPEKRQQLLASQYSLSTREMEVFQGLLAGMSNNEIAQKLFVADDTVKKHIGRIYHKTGVKTRSQLIALFIRH